MNWTQKHRLFFALLAGVCIVGLALAGCEEERAAPSGPSVSSADGVPVAEYPKDTPCPVCGETLGAEGDPIVFQQDGPPVMVCSKECMVTFKKDPAKYAPKPPAPPTE